MAAQRVRLGVLVRPHGLAGGLRCELDAEAVPAVATPTEAWVGFSESFLRPITLERVERRPQDLVCHFQGYAKREEAESLVDNGLWVPADILEYDSPFSHPRLVGYAVVAEDGTSLGSVESILKTPAHPVWSVAREGEESWLLPAVDAFVLSVDDQSRTVTARPIPGMTDEPSEDNEADPETR